MGWMHPESQDKLHLKLMCSLYASWDWTRRGAGCAQSLQHTLEQILWSSPFEQFSTRALTVCTFSWGKTSWKVFQILRFFFLVDLLWLFLPQNTNVSGNQSPAIKYCHLQEAVILHLQGFPPCILKKNPQNLVNLAP